jgi:threonine-phosphate decarboxylase
MIKGHGDDTYQYGRSIVANFSSNIYSHADLSALKDFLKERMEVIGSYPAPDASDLEQLLSKQLHLESDEVLVTSGATQAIYLIAQAFGGSNSAIFQPTFSEYADACRMHGHRVKSLFMLPTAREDYRLPEDVRMLWLCNPNNPTGQVVTLDELRKLLETNHQVLFVIDHSYEDFTLKYLLAEREALELGNVLLLHSMTKRFAVPGLRLGYVTGDAGLLRRLRNHQMPWAVNALALEAGKWLLEHDSLCVPQSLAAYLHETERLRHNLASLGALEVWDTDTHFMLVRLRMGKASALKEWLMQEKGILIRDASNFEGLDDSYFRIATQDPEENDLLVEGIAEWLTI